MSEDDVAKATAEIIRDFSRRAETPGRTVVVLEEAIAHVLRRFVENCCCKGHCR